VIDLAGLKYLNRKQGKEARADGSQPLVFDATDIKELDNDVTPIQHLPHLGDHKPNGWKRFNLGKIKDQFKYNYKIYSGDNSGYGAFFCSSGYGDKEEPALTIQEFIDSLKALWNKNSNLGYGITEAYQFQVKVGVFERKEA
jgi:hypothetical protein